MNGMEHKLPSLWQAAAGVWPRAYAPYSGFKVGAAILADDGAIYAGGNVENIAYPQGWCAETSALAQMVAAGGRRVLAVAVYAESTQVIVPCGGCRQKLSEFAAGDVVIYSCNASGVRQQLRLDELLPHSFSSLQQG